MTLVFGLQTPLCAVACLSQSAVASPAPVEADMPPCHGDDPAPSPSDTPDSHEACGCGAIDEPLAAKRHALDPPTASAWSAAPARYARLPQPRPLRVFSPPRDAALPPPDILLRNATLLI